MESVFFILVLFIFFLLLNIKNGINKKFTALQDKIDALTAELKRSRQLPYRETEKSMLRDEIVEQAFKKTCPDACTGDREKSTRDKEGRSQTRGDQKARNCGCPSGDYASNLSTTSSAADAEHSEA